MRSHALYIPALVLAALGAAIALIGTFSEPVRETLVRPMAIIAMAAVILLFLRILFDPQCRRGIDAANVELRDGSPWPGRFRIMFFDPEWGLFGSRMGGRSLQLIRTVLFLEFVVALVLTRNDNTDLLLLAAGSFAMTIMLTIIHVGLNTQSQSA